MDSLFENTYTAGKSFYQELYSYFHFRRPITVAAFIVCGICFASQLALAIFDLEYNLSIMILMALFPLFKLFAYVNQVNSITKRNKEISAEAINICSIVYEDHLEMTASNGSTLNIELAKIKSDPYFTDTVKYPIAEFLERLGLNAGFYEDFSVEDIDSFVVSTEDYEQIRNTYVREITAVENKFFNCYDEYPSCVQTNVVERFDILNWGSDEKQKEHARDCVHYLANIFQMEDMT